MVATGLAVGMLIGVFSAWMRNKVLRKRAAAGH
jgi:hypothetical protein